MDSTNPGPLGAAGPVTTITTTDLTPKPPAEPSNHSMTESNDPVNDLTEAAPLYPGGLPEPRGLQTPGPLNPSQGENAEIPGGTGVEGEVVVWEATYSMRNFIGRIAGRLILTLAWVALATYTWGMGHDSPSHSSLTWAAGAVVALLWLLLVVRVLQARYSHFYRLTNRRLFVSTGLVNRRRDMMELLNIKDVFTSQQSLLDRWLGLGTVVVVPDQKDIPTFPLPGVDDPKEVMDLIWHQARTERDQRTVKVDSI